LQGNNYKERTRAVQFDTRKLKDYDENEFILKSSFQNTIMANLPNRARGKFLVNYHLDQIIKRKWKNGQLNTEDSD